MVRGLRGEVVRVDRIASKRMTVSELRHGQDAIELGPRPAALLVWLVAVAGELRPDRALSSPPRSWGVYVYDATSGDTLASDLGSNGGWPPYFDGLPDH